MPLQKLPVTGLDDENHRRRAREVTNQILDHSFDDSRRQTDAEKLAGVTPVNPAFPPGDVRRYGADPTGVADSAPAWSTAISVNNWAFDGHPEGGLYRFNTEVTVSNIGVRISGIASDSGGTTGTRIYLRSSAGSGAAAFKTAAATPSVTFENIAVLHETTTTGQIGFRFGSDARFCKLIGCVAIGAQSVASTSVGIQFDGTGTYSAFNTIRECFISGHKYGVDLQSTCTVTGLQDCSFLGYTTSNSSYALKCANLSSYIIIGGHIEGFNTTSSRGIYSEGGYCIQIGVKYEVNTVNWEWVRTAPNTAIIGFSFGERFVSGGAPIYPHNNTDGCTVVVPGIADFDNTPVRAYRGFYEQGRTERLGNYNSVAFNASNFLANAGGSWTLTSPDQVTYQYRLSGFSMDVIGVFRSTTVGGSPTQLILTLPQTAVTSATIPCLLNVAGTREIGYATIAAGSNLVAFLRTGGAVFTAGSNNTDVEFQISVQI